MAATLTRAIRAWRKSCEPLNHRLPDAKLLRVAIVGAGTIGCYLGGRLHGVADVTLIGRPRIGEAIAAHGLTVSDYLGYRKHIASGDIAFATNMVAAANADLILVTVKSAATVDTAQALAAILERPTLVASMQNGLRNPALLRRHLPAQRVLAGMVPYNVVQNGPSAFHQGSSGGLMIDSDPLLAASRRTFAAAGIPLTQRLDMPAVQQAKLLLNLNNAINALSNLPLREELSQRAWRRCLAMAQREALEIFADVGMHPAKLTPLPARWLPAVLELPDRWFQRIAANMLAIDPLARSSMWEDLQLGRRTEVDAIQGEVLALAASIGRAAPVNAELIKMIRAAEQGVFSLGGEQLLTALRAATATLSDADR